MPKQSWVFRFLANALTWQLKEKEERKEMKENMRPQFTKIITRFEPDIEFEVGTIAPVPDRGTLEGELERMKERLLRAELGLTANPAPLRLAANEAAGLAWFTPFPLLFFPALFEEKVTAVRKQENRQKLIRARTESLLVQAVA